MRDAESQAGRPQTPGEPGRVDHRAAVAVPEPGEIGRARRPRPGSRRDPAGRRRGRTAARRRNRSRRSSTCQACGGDVEFAGAFEAAVDAVARDGGLDLVEVAVPELLQGRDLVAGSVPCRCASPCVRLAAQNPPLRPLAAQPTPRASRTTTSRCGSRSLAIRAVQRPVKPPPTIARSAVVAPASAGCAGRGVRLVEPERRGYGVRERHAAPDRRPCVDLVTQRRARRDDRVRARRSGCRTMKISVPMTSTCGGMPSLETP